MDAILQQEAKYSNGRTSQNLVVVGAVNRSSQYVRVDMGRELPHQRNMPLCHKGLGVR
jgi:hypothetical protein